MRLFNQSKTFFSNFERIGLIFSSKEGRKNEGGKQTFCLHVHYEPFFLFV